MKMDDSNERSEALPASKEVDVTFLPLIYDIIRSLERDYHDPTQKNLVSQDASQKVLEIQKRLEEAREKIRLLPGIEYNKPEQVQHLKYMRSQLLQKRQLILKFRNMYSFDVQKF